MKIRFAHVLFASLLVFSLILTSCAPVSPTAPAAQETEEVSQETAEKPTIVVAIDGDIDHIELQQFRTIAGYDATANLYEPLVTQKASLNASGVWIGENEFIGAGAETWDISDDGLVYTFHLRKEAKFADGTPVTAKDYYMTFDRAINGNGYIKLLLPTFAGIETIDQVKVVDDYTLQITQNKASALSLIVYGFQVLGAMSEKTIKEHATPEDPWAEVWHRTNANSSGPYIITSWKPGEEYVFEPNPYYWRGEDYYGNSKVIYRVIPDASTREQLLRAGDIDIAQGIPYKDVKDMQSDPNLTFYTIKTPRVYHAGMNVNKEPFDDINVRKAVSMAVDYQAIVDNVIYGFGQNPKSPVGEGMPTHTEEFWPYDGASLDEAKALLTEAGYPDGFEVDLLVPQEDQARMDAATWIQAGLAQIGVKVNINAQPTAQFNSLLDTHEQPFYMFEWYSWGNDVAFQLTWNFRCDAWTNYAMFCNPAMDKIIDDLIVISDPAQREQLSHDGQKMAVDAATWIYLYQNDWVIAARKGVSGVGFYNDLHTHFSNLTK
ncbi:MAG: ABC transporter substrate-binding protein [Chloroflexi bacterium]|nr:MAG: ABC transporter substrate-binding protein [Chloroflexota bacterium]